MKTLTKAHQIEKWRLNGKHHTRAQLAKLNHSRSHSNNKIKQVKATIKEYACSLLSHHNQRKKTLYEVQKVMHDIAPENPNSGPIRAWLADYTNYSDALKELTSELAAQAETILYTEPLIQGKSFAQEFRFNYCLDANQLLDETTKITNSLFQLGEAKNESEKAEVVEVVEKASRNKTAIMIRNRIKEKLEGSDPDKSATVSVSQQVNLCRQKK